MNILHMKYAVEVAEAGSINQAATKLYIAQPNLSRCIKELEAELGIQIFDRTSRGMKLTPDGEEYIRYARKILDQIDDLEKHYKKGASSKQYFSISIPRASYISDAFARFSCRIGTAPAEIYYSETNPLNAVNNILKSGFNLGIIRYDSQFDRYYRDMLDANDLDCEMVAEFKYVLIMNKDNSIANKELIYKKDLADLIEIAHGDPYVPSIPVSTIMEHELTENVSKRLLIYERGSQFELLEANPETFMWVSPVPQKILEKHGLVQRLCCDNSRLYKDMLIYKSGYRFTELDESFIEELYRSRTECFGMLIE